MKLGILESRIHLVGMHETVTSCNDKSEYAMFQKVIPSIPQRMIPRWHKSLYEPKAGALNQVSPNVK
jgi:hypothetical protein